MAALTGAARPGGLVPAARIAVVGLALAAIVALPAGAAAADPSSPPQPRPPTCAERYPEEGPAGVDLRLGCIVSELVGLYRPGQAAAPPAISTYVLGLIATIAGLAVLAGLATRLLARRAGRALAPVTPDTWWQCPRCRSVNGANAGRCYSCGLERPVETGVTLATEETPGITQTFGQGKRG